MAEESAPATNEIVTFQKVPAPISAMFLTSRFR